MRKRSPTMPDRPDSGVAFILVLAILLGLIVLAVPFLTTALNDHAVSASVIPQAEAVSGASAMLRYGGWWLERTTEAAERRRGGDPAADIFATPDWDTADEFVVPIDLAGDRGALLLGTDGVPLMSRKDPRGVTWDLKVRDEQSIANLWSAPPFLIAASLGRTVNATDLTPEDATIELEDGSAFPAASGAIWIEGERVTYARREGNRLLDCARGAPGGGRQRKHAAEAWVLDDRAREIAMLPFKSPRAKNGWREPLDVSAAKEISLFGEGVLAPTEVDRLAREFTTTSWRIAGDPFGPGQVLQQPVDPATADTSDGFKITVRSNDGINAGTLVRVTDGTNTEYGFVLASARRASWAVLTLAEPTKNAYKELRTSVAPMIRHPVNVNTASRDTLKRLLTGLQVTGGRRNPGTRGRVTAVAAELVADRLIANRPIKGLEHLRDVLVQASDASLAIFDKLQMVAVFRNAVDASDWTLGYSTVPFSFASHDYFTLTASAIVCDRAGGERGRVSVVERVRVAAPERTVFRLDSQEDFENAIVRARESMYMTTHPNPVERVNPWADQEVPASRIPRMLLYSGIAQGDSSKAGTDALKGVFPHKTEGDVRLWPARMEGFGAYIEHFDGQAFQIPDNVEVANIDPEGWILENGAYELPLHDDGQRAGGSRRSAGSRGPDGSVGAKLRVASVRSTPGAGAASGMTAWPAPSGSILGPAGVNPIKIDMWYRPETAGGTHTFFDLVSSVDPDQRITFSLQPTGEIHARVRDRTIRKPGSGLDEACETVFRPPAGLWAAKTWYHAGMSYRGCKPEEVSIWWDGMKRGEARFQTTLAGPVSATDGAFVVEHADDWPQRGVCWVGREALEYERTGTTFTAITYPNSGTTVGGNGRGRRGTTACPHAAGEVVQLFGYSTLVRPQLERGGFAIPRGGGNLASPLGPWNLASFEGNHTVSLPATPPMPAINWRVFDPAKPGGDQLQLALAPAGAQAAQTDYRDSFQATGGYIIMIGLAPMSSAPAQSALNYVAELAYYASFDPGTRTLFGIQPVPQPSNPDLAGGQIQTTQQVLYLHTLNPTSPHFCAVFPISVGMTSVSGYFTPAADVLETDPPHEYVSLGDPDYEDIQSHKIEWIRYNHVDTSRNALLCDEVTQLEATIADVTNILSRQINQGVAAKTPDVIARDSLKMRDQRDTEIFGYGKLNVNQIQVHQTSEDVTPVFRVVRFPLVGSNLPSQTAQSSSVRGSAAPGWGDSVTLETANATVRKRFDVTWSNGRRVSFGESAGQDFSQKQIMPRLEGPREQYLRLLKFPSGELPLIRRPAKGRAGGDVDQTPTAGRLDEVRVAPIAADRFIVWDHDAMGLSASQAAGGAPAAGGAAPATVAGISETATEIPIANVHWYLSPPTSGQMAGSSRGPRQAILPDGRAVEFATDLLGLPADDAGLVQIDDEIIAFRRLGRTGKSAPAILNCDRGVMNTTAQKHGFGANVVFLDFVPATMLSEALSPRASLVNVASEQGFATTGGLVLVDRELIHFSGIRGPTLTMPPILNAKGEETGGLFRGRFGTTAGRHDNEAIVIEMPFRYWDRFAESQDHPEISFYQFALNRPGAWFDRFGYEEFRPTPNVQLVALVRTEQDVPWCTDAAQASPNLLRFENGSADDKSLLPIGRHGTAFEARFYVRYLANSFDPVTLSIHDWKTTPELRWAEVSFFDETQVLHRETTK